MRKLSLALNCDGFLGNFVAGLLAVVEEVTGRHFEFSAVTGHDFAKALDLTRREEREVMRIIGARRGFAIALPPYPQARQGIRRLRELGEVFCVTTPWATNPWWCEEREAWLALHFGIDRVIHAIDKTSYEADVFVDGKAFHVSAWMHAWPGRVAVLWRTPHNSAELVPVGAHSISSWDVLYQLARREAQRQECTSMEAAS